MPGVVITIILLTLAAALRSSIYVLKEYERGVVFYLGKYRDTKGPGLIFIIPFLEKLIRVSQRVLTMDVPTQDVITKDNITIKVNAVLYFRVMEPSKAIIRVENFIYATSQLAQTTLRTMCGEVELDELLSDRDVINKRIQEIIDRHTDPWGIKVSSVEIKDIDLPQEMKRAMAQQAEAERERRAKIIQAEGEFQAAEKLTAAANIMATQGLTIQLRYLETLRDIATEHNSTIVFPIPLEFSDVLKSIAAKTQKGSE